MKMIDVLHISRSLLLLLLATTNVVYGMERIGVDIPGSMEEEFVGESRSSSSTGSYSEEFDDKDQLANLCHKLQVKMTYYGQFAKIEQELRFGEPKNTINVLLNNSDQGKMCFSIIKSLIAAKKLMISMKNSTECQRSLWSLNSLVCRHQEELAQRLHCFDVKAALRIFWLLTKEYCGSLFTDLEKETVKCCTSSARYNSSGWTKEVTPCFINFPLEYKCIVHDILNDIKLPADSNFYKILHSLLPKNRVLAYNEEMMCEVGFNRGFQENDKDQ